MNIIKCILLALALVFVGVLLTLAMLLRASREVSIDSRMELISCAVAVQDYRNTHEKWPASQGRRIDATTSTELGMGGGGRADEWGRSFLFTLDPGLDQAVLQTHGADGQPGNRDGDLRVVVTPQQLTIFSE